MPPKAQPTLSVEAITSLMLVLDSVLAAWFDAETCPEGPTLCLCANNSLEVRSPCSDELSASSGADQDFIMLELAAISGSLYLAPEEGRVRILFSAL